MADSIRNESSDYGLYERFAESLTHSIRSKMWICSVTKHHCVARSETQNSFCCSFDWNIFISEIEQKQSILCLKCKSLNFNFLFIELLLYKITLQSCWNILFVQCCVPNSYIIIIFFLLPLYASISFCVFCCAHLFWFLQESLTHSLRLHEPHLADINTLCRKCDVTTYRLGISRQAGHPIIAFGKNQHFMALSLPHKIIIFITLL